MAPQGQVYLLPYEPNKFGFIDEEIIIEVKMFERIGKIESTQLGVEDHGIMTFWLLFNFGGSEQGFGGCCLDTYSEEEKRMIGTAAGMDIIMQILEVCGVSDWEDIKGKTLYALYDTDRVGQKIQGIKGLPFESNKSFLLREWEKKWFPNIEGNNESA